MMHDENSLDSLNDEIAELDSEIAVLKQVILDTFWMARRYANGRKTTTPYTINESIRLLKNIGIEIPDDHTLIEDGNSSARTLDVG